MKHYSTQQPSQGLGAFKDPFTFPSIPSLSLSPALPPPSDPMQSVLQTLERQHEEEKRTALERQRQMYEQELQQLRKQLPPAEKHTLLLQGPGPAGLEPAGPSAASLASSPCVQTRMRRWSEDR